MGGGGKKRERIEEENEDDSGRVRGRSATLHSEVFHFNGPPGDWLTLLEDPSPFQHNGPLHYLFVLANVLPEATAARFHVLPFPRTINRRLNSRPSGYMVYRYREGENVISKRRIFVHRDEYQHLYTCVKILFQLLSRKCKTTRTSTTRSLQILNFEIVVQNIRK